jgi:cyclase
MTAEGAQVHRTLIVAKFDPDDAGAVARIFAESDAGELPHLIGVNSRSLFRFHDLYFHLVEADDDITPNLYRARKGELFADINSKLSAYIRPYDPGWKEPKDAMAESFYEWRNDVSSSERRNERRGA